MVDGKIHQLNHQSVYTFNPLNSVFNFKHFVKIWSCSNLACIADETKLWLSLSVKQCRNPCSGPYLCTSIWVRTMIGLLKMPFFLSRWKEIQNTLPVICWLHWGSEHGYHCCIVEVAYWGKIMSAIQAGSNHVMLNFCTRPPHMLPCWLLKM